MRIYQNFTILIPVCKEEKEIKLSSRGRKIEDELEEYMLSLNRKKCLSMAENAKVRRRQEASKKIYEYISTHEK